MKRGKTNQESVRLRKGKERRACGTCMMILDFVIRDVAGQLNMYDCTDFFHMSDLAL